MFGPGNDDNPWVPSRTVLIETLSIIEDLECRLLSRQNRRCGPPAEARAQRRDHRHLWSARTAWSVRVTARRPPVEVPYPIAIGQPEARARVIHCEPASLVLHVRVRMSRGED